MSENTAIFKKQIEAAKVGDEKALKFLKQMIVAVAQDEENNVPIPVITALAELILGAGLDSAREAAERN